MASIRDAIAEVLRIEQPMTCRQVFYQLVSRGVIPKSEAEYQRTVIRLLVDMRRKGDVPWGWISDQTRWIRRPRMHSNLEELLSETSTLYRRDLWRDQDCHVEIWLEKDALAGVLTDVTYKFGVPLMVSRGYASLSYLQATAEYLSNEYSDKPCYLYHFGDHDPSGLGIGTHIEQQLREFAPEVEIHFEKASSSEDQRRALWLVHGEGMSNAAAADAMAKSEPALRGLCSRGLKALRKLLRRSGVLEPDRSQPDENSAT